MNLTHFRPQGQPYAEFITQCPDDPEEAAIWLFERAERFPGMPNSKMRLYRMHDVANDIHSIRVLTLLRSLSDNEPCGIHVSDTVSGSKPTFSFVGTSVNTYALVGTKNETQYFIEPDVDLSLCILFQPSVLFGEFHHGTAPALQPEEFSVWTRRPATARLVRPTIRKIQAEAA